jgi:hypothetical protein
LALREKTENTGKNGKNRTYDNNRRDKLRNRITRSGFFFINPVLPVLSNDQGHAASLIGDDQLPLDLVADAEAEGAQGVQINFTLMHERGDAVGAGMIRDAMLLQDVQSFGMIPHKTTSLGFE